MLDTFVLLAAAGAMVCWGFGDFFIQRVIRRVGTIEALALIGIFGSVAMLPFVWRDLHLLLHGNNLLLVGCLAIATFLTGVLNFEALRKGKLAIVEVILTLELPVTIILSILIFRETLTLAQTLVIATIFLGIVLISLQQNPFTSRLRWERGAWIGLFTALLYGFLNFMTAASAQHTTPWIAIWLPWTTIGILSLVVISQQHGLKAMVIKTERWHWLVLVMGLLDTGAWLCYAFAVRGGDVSIVTAITESYPVIALVLGVWLNRERIRKHQWLGAALALGAGVLLALLS